MKSSRMISFRFFLISLVSIFPVLSAGAEVVVSSSTKAYYSFGIAAEDQMVASSTEDGVYDEKKNGFYIDSTIGIKGSIDYRLDFSLGLTIKNMSGSPYLDLQLAPSSPSGFEVSLDHVYSRFYLTDLLFGGIDLGFSNLAVNLMAGKFAMKAVDNSISHFRLESSVGNVKLANSPTLDLESVMTFSGFNQFYDNKRSSLTLNLAAGGLFGEDVQRLYDSDGGMSMHGEEVLGEYAPQFYGDLILDHYILPFGALSASASYAYNGMGFYTGHSAGISTTLEMELIDGKMYLPISLNGGYFQKNIDVLASAADNVDGDTTDFRDTIRAGASIGFRYYPQPSSGVSNIPRKGIELALSGSWNRIGHIYRDPLSIISLAIDGTYYFTPKIYVGGGFILGTLGNAMWQTSSSVSTSLDDYSHTFSIPDNYGYEAFAGLDFLGVGSLTVGFAQKKGLAMNYGIETIQTGMIKYRQSGSTLADRLWETGGIFVKAEVKF